MAVTIKAPAAPKAPRVQTSLPAPRVAKAKVAVAKPAAPKRPVEGASRVRNGVRYVYKGGKWVRAGKLRGTTLPVTTPAPAPTQAPSFAPTSSWWMQQFAADPRYMTQAPILEAERGSVGQEYGFTVARDDQGRALYKTSGGATGITQQMRGDGSIVYRDAAGNEYAPADLALDVRRIPRGQAGYLAGRFGAAEAASGARQQRIGEEAAQAGIGRSGMRAASQSAESAGLQSTLAGLTGEAGRALAGVDTRFGELYREIYKDLVERADELSEPTPETTTETTTTTTPVVQPTGAWWNALPSGKSGGKRIVPASSRGVFVVAGNPGGGAPKSPKPGMAYKGTGGVVWVYRSKGPRGRGWYKRQANR